MVTNAAAVVLAAGKGERMRSALPKVLHAIGGKPMIERVLDAALASFGRAVVVVGAGADEVRRVAAREGVAFATQVSQRGTGDALLCALPELERAAFSSAFAPGAGGDGDRGEGEDPPGDRGAVAPRNPSLDAPVEWVAMLCGDCPLVEERDLTHFAEGVLREAKRRGGRLNAAVLTAVVGDPRGYGRILRDASGAVERIVEQAEATEAEAAVCEINTGVLFFSLDFLRRCAPRLARYGHAEVYATDLIDLANQEAKEGRGLPALAARCADPQALEGVNDRFQLAAAERRHQRRLAERMARQGLGMADPERLDVRGTLKFGKDCFVDCNVVFEGDCELGDGARVGPNCFVKDSKIGRGAQIEAFCHIVESDVGAFCSVGPFARLRPRARLLNGAKIGDFVEIKKSTVGEGTKINHLSYIGDATVGAGCNIGAGVITCNYDGRTKSPTKIGDGAFVGSNCVLVAPIEVGPGAYLGAGSTITKDCPDGMLTVSRTPQRSVPWKGPKKK